MITLYLLFIASFNSDVKPKLVSKDDLTVHGYNMSTAAKSLTARPKALINPFDPSHVTIKLTSNRRRWTHVFPLGPTGIFMQQHHYQAVPQNTACTMLPSEACIESEQDPNRKVTLSLKQGQLSAESPFSGGQRKISPRAGVIPEECRPRSGTQRISIRGRGDPDSDNMSYAWGATGEQEWTPAITTGVDWKSLVVPACLPVTTDFFPDKRSLQNDYVMSDYTLLPEEQGQELLNRVCYRGGEDLRNHIPFSTFQVLQELICQRLQQGFQLVLLQRSSAHKQSIVGQKDDSKPKGEVGDYTLSIGRIFHRLHIENNVVLVSQYRPRHPYPVIKIHYCYRFRAPDNETFGVSWVDFTSERLENYNWNYLDNYICLRGEDSYELRDSLKFWRFRLLILPNICHSITKRIIETKSTGETELRCLGAYRESTHEDRMQIFEGFIKFIGILSKMPHFIKNEARKQQSKDRRGSLPQSVVNVPSTRERSNTSIVRSGRPSRMLLGANQAIKEARDEVDGSVQSSMSVTVDAISPKSPREETNERSKLAVLPSVPEIVEKMKSQG